MSVSSLLRITCLAFLSLTFVAPASANRVRNKKSGNNQIKTSKVRKTTKNSVRPNGQRQVGTALAGGRTQSRGKLHLSNEVSITKADSAVLTHLAQPLSLGGPRAARLSGANALAAIEKKWKITDSKVLSNVNPAEHPITGNAIVLVKAKSASEGRIGSKLGLKVAREFVVNIGVDGNATVLAERGGSRAAKIMRSLNERFAISRVVKDVMRSAGVRKAGATVGFLGLAVLAGKSGMSEMVTQLTEQLQMVGPVVVTAAAYAATNGVGRRTLARDFAFQQLTQSLDRERRAGKSISEEQAYCRYEKSLKTVKIGDQITKNVKPPARETFVNALAAWEAARSVATP